MKKLLNLVKKLIKRILYGKPKDPSVEKVKRLRSKGVRIGERTTFYAPHSCVIDTSRPWLIEIGDDVQIAYGVTIMTHGYDWSVLKGVYGDVLGSSGKVTIGNNVFIGVHTTILKGATIGNNVIIGAGSVVTRDIPDNCVAAGNPARVIMSLEDYYEKRKKAQLEEAKELVQEYRKVYGKDPDEAALSEFFWLFTKDPALVQHPTWIAQMQNLGNQEFSNQVLASREPQFQDMQDFLNHC